MGMVTKQEARRGSGGGINDRAKMYRCSRRRALLCAAWLHTAHAYERRPFTQIEFAWILSSRVKREISHRVMEYPRIDACSKLHGWDPSRRSGWQRGSGLCFGHV